MCEKYFWYMSSLSKQMGAPESAQNSTAVCDVVRQTPLKFEYKNWTGPCDKSVAVAIVGLEGK
jgi:hypothetical protein